MICQVVNILSTKISNPMIRSDLCDYSDEYSVVKEVITVKGTGNTNRRN